MNVQGKVAVVTGATSGVGEATARQLAALGAKVVINYRQRPDDANQIVDEIKAAGGEAIAIAADVSQDEDCRKLMQSAVDTFGQLDILVNNAGTTRFIPHDDLESVTDEVWDSIFAVNVKGPFQCIRAAAPFLKQSQSAEIVSVSSVAGLSIPGSSVPYSASKAALINMTINLARALSPEIRVNSIAPGFIEGKWLHEGLGDRFDAIKQAVVDHNVLDDVCRPDDIAEAILSLITGSDLVTGQTLVVDAGQIIGPRTSSIGKKD